MADEINIRIRADGQVQVNGALVSIGKNLDRINTNLRGQQSTLKASGQVFNQFGNMVRSFGSNELANLTNQIEGSLVGLRSMNAELGKSRIAVAAMVVAAAVGGNSIGNYLRKFTPFFNEPDKLESMASANLKALQIAEKINALKDPANAGAAELGSELRAIDEQIKTIRDKAFGLYGIKGLFAQGVNAQDENLILQLERLKDALKKVNDERKISDTLGAFRFGEEIVNRNQMRGSPQDRLGALHRAETDRLDELLSSSKFKEMDRLIKQRQAELTRDSTMVAPADQLNLREEAYRDHYARLAELSKGWYDGERARAEADLDAKRRILEEGLRGARDMFGNMAEVALAFGKKGFAAYKAFATAQAMIATYLSAVEAYKSTVGIPYIGPFVAPIAAAAAVAAGMANIAQIHAQNPQGYQLGGYTGNVPTNQVAGNVHGQEFVINAPETRRIGVPNIQEFVSSGGERSQSVSVSSPKVSLAFVNGHAEYRRFLQTDPEAEKWVVDMVTKNKMRIGIA